MDHRFLALAKTLTQPVVKPNVGPWDWEAAFHTPNFGIAAAASWLASKFTRPTVRALRALHA
jgi:hypothetical protein